MKNKALLILIALLFVFKIKGQTDSSGTVHRYELGADVTALMKQFLNFSQNSGYTPVYYFSYRYHLKNSNIRFGLGGNYSSRAIPSFTVNGAEKIMTNKSGSLSFRIGYEKTSELSPKWQAFYGIDFRPSFTNTNNEAESSNKGYINGSVSSSQVYGLAPLLGFRYRISKRVSVLTEGSISLNVEKSASQRTYVSTDNVLYPSIPYSKKTTVTNLMANFNQPLFLIFAIDL